MAVPAAVEETGTAESPGAFVPVTLASPASDGDVLVILCAGVPTVDRVRAVFASGGFRKAINIDLSGEELASSCDGVVVPLRANDQQFLLSLNGPSGWGLLGWAHISGTPGIPTDWTLYWNTRDPGEVLKTQPFESLDDGLFIAMGVIVGASVTLTEPAGWTDADTIDGAAGAAQFTYGPLNGPGWHPGVFWQAGTVPTGSTGEVYWYAAYGTGLRVRDAGGWVTGGNLSIVDGGTAEPPAPLSPPLRPLPKLPPDGPGVVVPTPPWIPGTGPYRSDGT